MMTSHLNYFFPPVINVTIFLVLLSYSRIPTISHLLSYMAATYSSHLCSSYHSQIVPISSSVKLLVGVPLSVHWPGPKLILKVTHPSQVGATGKKSYADWIITECLLTAIEASLLAVSPTPVSVFPSDDAISFSFL